MAQFQDPFEKHFHFNNGRRNPVEKRTHIFQGYKNVPQTGHPDIRHRYWEEIKKDDIRTDVGRTPKIMDKLFYYVVSEGRDYVVNECYAAIVLYDHITDDFIYARSDGSFISERNIFDSPDEALNRLRSELKKMEGKITSIVHKDGTMVKIPRDIWSQMPCNKEKEESNTKQ